MDEPDSFKRQKEALLRLTRQLKRVPFFDEALQFLHDERLFSGPWEENLARRKTRVKSILKFIARSFDAAKCGRGSVNVGKYAAWAAARFPHGLRGQGHRDFTEYGEIVDRLGVHFSHQFIAVFLAICEFALLIDKNQDGTLPHNRAKEIWDALFTKGVVSIPFCARKWAACREEMVRYGIIQITDRNYGPDKAMKWSLG